MRWLHGVFKDFYLGGRFDGVRHLLEYDYPNAAGPLLKRCVDDRRGPVTFEEMEVLQSLDTLLTYFEHILYLEQENQISHDDRVSVFEYWFGILGSEGRESLERYIEHFGWARVAEEIPKARARADAKRRAVAG